jgi:hypothetical protein
MFWGLVMKRMLLRSRRETGFIRLVAAWFVIVLNALCSLQGLTLAQSRDDAPCESSKAGIERLKNPHVAKTAALATTANIGSIEVVIAATDSRNTFDKLKSRPAQKRVGDQTI